MTLFRKLWFRLNKATPIKETTIKNVVKFLKHSKNMKNYSKIEKM